MYFAPSDVAGWGVFIKESCQKNELIGEYCGEVSHCDVLGKLGRSRSIMIPINVFPVFPSGETWCLLSVFSCLSISETIDAGILSYYISMFPCLSISRNIVAEALCFLSMFPSFPTSRNIVPETDFVSQRGWARMFLNQIRNIFVAKVLSIVPLFCYY